MRVTWALILCGAIAAPAVARADRDDYQRHEWNEHRAREGYRGDMRGGWRSGDFNDEHARHEWFEHHRGQYGPMFGGPGWNGHREYRDRRWARPRIDIDLYARPFLGRPRFHRFGTYGLPPALQAYPNLSFLSSGMLVGSYYQDDRMVYVYIIDEDGQHHEIRVDQFGTILGDQIVP